MTRHEAQIFAAGQSDGARVAAGVARLAAAQLMEDARWWNRWRRRLLASALIAYAEEMEQRGEAAPTRPWGAEQQLTGAPA